MSALGPYTPDDNADNAEGVDTEYSLCLVSFRPIVPVGLDGVRRAERPSTTKLALQDITPMTARFKGDRAVGCGLTDWHRLCVGDTSFAGVVFEFKGKSGQRQYVQEQATLYGHRAKIVFEGNTVTAEVPKGMLPGMFVEDL